VTWFKVDDKSAFHAKVVRAGNEAWGAVCRAGAWSSEQGTDGFIPDEIASMIARVFVWNRAESCGGNGRKGLVERVEGGWQLHDFLDWNPSAAQIDAKREATRKRVEQWRVKQVSNALPTALVTPVETLLPTRPDPSRSDPPCRPPQGGGAPESDAGKGKSRKKPAHPCPPDWTPKPEHYAMGTRAWVDSEAAKMRDHFASEGKGKADWDATFRNWLRRAPEFARGQVSIPEPDPRKVADLRARQTAKDIDARDAGCDMTPSEQAAAARDLRAMLGGIGRAL